MKVGIITQARMTSTRLPGKVMLSAAGRPMLDYHLERLAQSSLPIILATTTNTTDDVLADFGGQKQIQVFRGDEKNVLSRYYLAALKSELDVVIRVTSDCPLIDGQLIKDGLKTYLELGDERVYLANGNGLQRSFPRGFDFEIFSFKLLKEAMSNAVRPEELEHVTPYLYKYNDKVRQVPYTQATDKSAYRVTMDTPEDYQLICELIEFYNAANLDYKAITTILDAHPELVAINAGIEQIKLSY